ncbi:TylF/MycF/NovP-related O-methyltransferase [Roseomonas sp. CCTCC AB2023176]|uniref:TylF/MycF/NovP-related O-methyltransferase n=1 Tax=Roseomonas sp. CCTCC AB2023176 TaxID=3342640 RepID=UPI0035D6ACFD
MDRWTGRAMQAEFDATIRRSRAVATASNAMSAEYERIYGVRSIALIACHDRGRSFAPEPRMRRDGEMVVGMAGQFYADAEWQTLVRALNATDWTVGGRSVSLLVLGHAVPDSPIPKGRSRFLGWVPQEEAIRILSGDADVLFCPYPFAEDMAEVSRLSFPSKLVSYLAAGRPVLFHGPSFAAPAKYLTERKAGVVTLGSGAANVHNALERLATDPAHYAALAEAGHRAFLEDFTLERMRERALSFFGTTMEALTPAAPPEPFDYDSPAAQIPPPREDLPDTVRLRRAVVARLDRTPARPLIGIARRSVHAYNRLRWAPALIWSLHGQVQSVEAGLKHLGTRLDDVLEEARSTIDREANRAAVAEEARRVAEVRSRELSVSVAVLHEQLAASAKAYAHLAEVNTSLNRRFDSVASSALGKLAFVEEGVRRLSGEAGTGQAGTGAAGGGADRYLDLLEGILTGTLLGDASISPFAGPGYDPNVRMLGRDWPEHALTMIGTVRMRNIRTLLETLLRDGVPGDLVETGVWRGGACLYMRAILQAHGDRDRRVWVADSFRGLPEPDAEAFPADAGDTHHTQADLAVSADQVRASFARFGLLDGQVRFLEGWFKDTLPAAPIERIALLRLDGDMYESTWQALEALYHKVSPGGFVVVDDYILPACAKAIDDWRAREGITAPLVEVDGAAVYWRRE